MEEGKFMKEIKIIATSIAVIVGSFIAITIFRLTIANYAIENLKQTTDHALNNITQHALESNERLRQQIQERAAKDEEIKKQREIALKNEAIEKEKDKKETSPECQFWKLQNKNHKTERTEAKIKEYCGYT